MNLSLNSGINFANDMDNINEIEMLSPEEMQSPFEAIKETDGEGRLDQDRSLIFFLNQ